MSQENKSNQSPSIPIILLLFAVVFLFYLPALRGGFIWDDDAYVQNNTNLRSIEGLRKIWFEPSSIPQYYPLVHTTFWIEYHLWGLKPAGYHAVNIFLHALNALLLAVVLNRLGLRVAVLVAFIFALHPVHVESAAWITERKNVLSGTFYLSALLMYLNFSGGSFSENTHQNISASNGRTMPSWKYYWAALALFICALWSKTVTCSLPAVILVLLWWKKSVTMRSHAIYLMPFFALGLLLGLTTAWLEKHHVGAKGFDWSLTFVERCLVAGRALWFYTFKLIWPDPLIFIYPRWNIDQSVWWQYLFPVAFVGLLLLLWSFRVRLGRGPLAGVLIFSGTLFPALGFFDVYPFRFSFVADHFQYLASIGMLTVLCSAVALGMNHKRNLPIFVKYAFAILVCGVFGLLVWKQAKSYESLEILWRDTIAKNPRAWIAHNNLGIVLERQKKYDEAIRHYMKAIELKSDYDEAYNNLGMARARKGDLQESIEDFKKALAINPNLPEAHNNLGTMLAMQKDMGSAIGYFRKAVELKPSYVEAWFNFAKAQFETGDFPAASESFGKVVSLEPGHFSAWYNLGLASYRMNQFEESESHLKKAIQLNPSEPGVYFHLGLVKVQQKKWDEARNYVAQSINLDSNFQDAKRLLNFIDQNSAP